MSHYYNPFWLEYCSGSIELDIRFKHRDDDFINEGYIIDNYNISGRVLTSYYNEDYGKSVPIGICNILGQRI